MRKSNRAIAILLMLIIQLLFLTPAVMATTTDYKAPEVLTDGAALYIPEEPAEIGFLFYCGAPVDHRAYSGILGGLAERGYFTASLDAPLDVSMLNPLGAKKLMKQYPEIKHWFIGGHSNGGVMASALCTKLTPDFEGLVLLASYSIVPVDVPVLSMYGSNDGVLVMPLYELSKPFISKNLTEIIIEGGNHAQFGNYGKQFLDHEATISMEEQQQRTIEAIDAFIQNNHK